MAEADSVESLLQILADRTHKGDIEKYARDKDEAKILGRCVELIKAPEFSLEENAAIAEYTRKMATSAPDSEFWVEYKKLSTVERLKALYGDIPAVNHPEAFEYIIY